MRYLLKFNESKKEIKYYINATVTYKDSYKRSGGYYTYTDGVINNAIVKVIGSKAYIYPELIKGQLWLNPIIKMTRGKYFNIMGDVATEEVFDSKLKKMNSMLTKNNKKKSTQDDIHKENRKNYENRMRKVFYAHLTPELVLEYYDMVCKLTKYDRITEAWDSIARKF